MNIKKISAILLGMAISFTSLAQTVDQQNTGFRKGFYLGLDASAGIVNNDRVSLSSRNMGYGIDVAAGYRFLPQLVVAAGLGGHSYTNATATVSEGKLRTNQTTSVPVFFRLRSDFLDRKVSPYARLDLGYSFVFLYSRDAGNLIRNNNSVFMNKVEDMGFETLEQYEEFFRNEHTQLLAGAGLDEEELAARVNAQWKAEEQRLKQFTNGSCEYIPVDNLHLQYGKKGLFASLDLGVSWKVGESSRMNVGISAGLSQSYYGTCLRTVDNRFLHFGRLDYLPYEKKEDRVYVRTVGQEDFRDSFDLDLKLKIGFSF